MKAALFHRGRLARLRANPKRVRVAIRRMPDGRWLATVQSREDGRAVGCLHNVALRALARAIRSASDAKFPGVDLGMDWAYVHPQLS